MEGLFIAIGYKPNTDAFKDWLEVDDKANSAGEVVDAIRYCRIAMDKKVGGPLIEASAWLMKHPPKSLTDEVAMEKVGEWVSRSA